MLNSERWQIEPAITHPAAVFYTASHLVTEQATRLRCCRAFPAFALPCRLSMEMIAPRAGPFRPNAKHHLLLHVVMDAVNSTISSSNREYADRRIERAMLVGRSLDERRPG